MNHDVLDWRTAALCAQTDPDAFFPPVGAVPQAALRVCAECPVRAECLTDALARRDVEFGVLGGLTPRQRRELLRTQTQVERLERQSAALASRPAAG